MVRKVSDGNSTQTKSSQEKTKTDMIIEGTQEDHTSHADGSFKHPFLNAPSHINTIHYQESNTFSTKL